MKEFVVSPELNKRLISNLLSSSSTPRENENFILKGSREFNSRSNDVFGQLETLEQSHEAWICENNTGDLSVEKSCLAEKDSSKRLEIASKSPTSNTNHNSSSERVVEKKNNESPVTFKKPHLSKINRRRLNATKTFLKYGKKWTKYSLADIPLSSNATNASIALSFINELRKSKTSLKGDSDESNQILFSKPKMCHSSSSSASVSGGITSSDTSTLVKRLKKNPDTIKLSHLETDSD